MTVAERYCAIEERIDEACLRAGRPRSKVVLVGASKRQPLSTLQAAVDAGLRILGENRVQEAAIKSPILPLDVEWHLIGPLQTNKAKSAARLFSAIHSLDRPKVIHHLDRAAAKEGRQLEGFVQVNLGQEPTKHGFAPESLANAVAPFAALGHLRIIGLMAIPPYERNLENARLWFRQLRELRDDLASRPEWQGHRPWPGKLSMGMSHDFDVAIEEGATHVRVGSALFGARES